MPADDKLVLIACRVPPAVAAGISQKATAVKMANGAYAAQLLIAAYSARVRPPTGDRDLDAAVGRVAVLYAEQRNTADIADFVGLTEPTVVRILDAWRAEIGLGKVA